LNRFNVSAVSDQNDIRVLNANAFNGPTKLRMILLRGNSCIDQDFSDEVEEGNAFLKEMPQILKEKCPEKAEDN
jgi:hypothetical protein